MSTAISASIASATASTAVTSPLMTPTVTFLAGFSLLTRSPSEIIPEMPREGDKEERRLFKKRVEERVNSSETAGVAQSELSQEVGAEDVEDLESKYLQPVFARNQSIISELLTALSVHLLVGCGLEGNVEVSVCAICRRDESEDRICLSSPLPQQLHLYCGTAVIRGGTQPFHGLYRSSRSVVKVMTTTDRDKTSQPDESTDDEAREREYIKRISLLPMIPVLNLGTTLSSCSYLDDHCAAVMACGIILIDLRKGISKAQEIQSELVAKKRLNDKRIYSDTQIGFQSIMSDKTCASSIPSSWAGGTISFVPKMHQDPSQALPPSVSVCAYRNIRPALLTILFEQQES